MASMYELNGEWMQLYAMFDDPDMDEDALLDTMEAIEGEIELKAENTMKVIKNFDGEVATLDAEIKRLTERKKAIESKQSRLKGGIEKMMQITGKTKFKTELFSFGIQKNAPSLKVNEDVDVWKLPEEFLVYHDPTIDKVKVKEAIKAGQEFDWAHMEQSESLRIR